mgnify:CR=1 FL=1
MFKLLLTCLAIVLSVPAYSVTTSDEQCAPLNALQQVNPADYPILAEVLQQSDKYRLQIIYTEVNRDADNTPHTRCFEFGVDDQRYFYPASTVKLPIAALALEWLDEQQVKGLGADSTMLTDTAIPWQTAQHSDETAQNGLPSIAHYIKQILLVSDNNSSNRLYELLGQDFINSRLAAKGLDNTVINHRLSLPLTAEQNQLVNPVRFLDSEGQLLLSIPARKAKQQYVNAGNPELGKGFIQNGKLVLQPMSFADKNRQSLTDFDGVIKRIVFPQLYPSDQRFVLSRDSRNLLLRYMAMLPPQSRYPTYDSKEYPDNYSKFLLFGGKNSPIPDDIRIFNKTGWAYGHIIDGAYIIDLKHKVEFFLSAVIYANDNDILNDDQYQTKEIALPFLQQLGQYIYQLELKRKNAHLADLNEFSEVSTVQ